MRARMALLMAQRQVLAHEIVLRDKPPAMLAASPKGTVPVLVLPDSQVIDESLHIMQWALAQSSDPGLGLVLQDPQALAWIARNDGEFKAQLDRYKYPQRFGVSDRQSPRDAAVAGLLHDMNALLSRQAYMAGLSMSALDVALFPFVRQFAAVDAAWFSSLNLPALQAWLKHCVDSAWFTQAMVKLPDQAPQLFPNL